MSSEVIGLASPGKVSSTLSQKYKTKGLRAWLKWSTCLAHARLRVQFPLPPLPAAKKKKWWIEDVNATDFGIHIWGKVFALLVFGHPSALTGMVLDPEMTNNICIE